MKLRTTSIFAAVLVLSLAVLLLGCGKDTPTTPPGLDIGAQWRLVESGIDNSIRAIAIHDSLLVVVGDGGIIYSSTDGGTWTRRRESGPNDGLEDVVWFDSLFIAVGMNGTLITSHDAATWTFVGIEDQANLYGVAASDTLAVAVGSGGSIYTSTDGIEWLLNRADPARTFHDVAYVDSLWVICGDGGTILRSADGLDWQPQTTIFGSEITFPAITAADSVFFAVSFDSAQSMPNQCGVYKSSDGATWFFQAPLDAWYIHDIFWTGTELIAVGEGTNYHLGFPDGLLFHSSDGLVWEEQATDAPFSLTTVAKSDSTVLVGGSGGYVLTGSQSTDISIACSGAELTGAVWNGSEYVAVTARGTVMRSSDGDFWTERHSRVSVSFDRLAYSGSAYVALGGFGAPTEIYTSPDATTWARTLEFQDVVLKDIIWGGGRFVACGQNGAVFLSDAGASWTRYFVGDDVTLRCVIWDGQRYVAATSAIAYFSSDGQTWTKAVPDPIDNEPAITRMVWTGTQYVTVGNRDEFPGGLQGYAYTSADAVHWQVHALGARDYLYDIVGTSTRLIACGRSGTLLTSTDGSTWATLASGTEQHLMDIVVGGGRALAVGGNRTVLVSP
jgi:hypothetical protein